MSDVTAPELLIKQTTEKRLYQMIFDNLLKLPGETVTGVLSLTAEKIGGGSSDLTFGTTTIIDGDTIQWAISDGSAGTDYRVDLLVGTSSGLRLAGDGILRVVNK